MDRTNANKYVQEGFRSHGLYPYAGGNIPAGGANTDPNNTAIARDRAESTQRAISAGQYHKDASGGYTFGADPHSDFEHPTQNNLSPVQGDN